MGWLQNLLGKDATFTQNLETSEADKILWDEVSESSGAIRNLSRKGEERLPTWPALLEDVFSAFYKSQPTLRDESEVEPGHLANRRFVQELLQEPATEQTRSFTVLDESVSALAAVEAAGKMLEVLLNDPGTA